MNKTHLCPSFTDDRGSITDILGDEKIDAVTIITFTEGAVRANHYHKETTQWNYVLTGKLEAVTQKIGAERKQTIIEVGDLIISEPNESHAFRAMEYSVLLILTQGPRAGTEYEKDTFRLESPLI